MLYSTKHTLLQGPAAQIQDLDNESVQLVVTSPPYPMISMWDTQFAGQSKEIAKSLSREKGPLSFELMHQELDKSWIEMYRILQSGGFLCINIGDATRTINEHFALYPNGSRITTSCVNIGFTNLPNIIWRKPTNAPNKYMGSGVYPAGAYVTLEHEHILIFRKGGKRNFTTGEEKKLRRRSAIFWEERNEWYSDLWQLKGASQNMNILDGRNRSAAFPMEIPFRLIQMYSVQEDLVVDPYLGSGTSIIAAMSSGRSSLGIDLEDSLIEMAKSRTTDYLHTQPNSLQLQRLKMHEEQVKSANPEFYSYLNDFYHFPVKTRQETDLILPGIKSFDFENNEFILEHVELYDQDKFYN